MKEILFTVNNDKQAGNREIPAEQASGDVHRRQYLALAEWYIMAGTIFVDICKP